MKVYIVMWEQYEDWDIVGVFDSEDKANEFINNRTFNKHFYVIEKEMNKVPHYS